MTTLPSTEGTQMKSKVKRAQFTYVLESQRRTDESAEPDIKHASLDTTDVRARTSELGI